MMAILPGATLDMPVGGIVPFSTGEHSLRGMSVRTPPHDLYMTGTSSGSLPIMSMIISETSKGKEEVFVWRSMVVVMERGRGSALSIL